MPSKLLNKKSLKPRRQKLRKNSTVSEKMLWKCLKGSSLKGRKFRRQQSIGSYIVDFYCPSERLVVELDGEMHEDEAMRAYDLRRDAFLKRQRFTVLRFSNGDVVFNMDEVLEKIAACFLTTP